MPREKSDSLSAVSLPVRPRTVLAESASDAFDDGDGDDDDDVFVDGALCPVQGPRSSLHPTSGYYSATRPPRRLLLTTAPLLPIALSNFSARRSTRTCYLKVTLKIFTVHRYFYISRLAKDSFFIRDYIARSLAKHTL